MVGGVIQRVSSTTGAARRRGRIALLLGASLLAACSVNPDVSTTESMRSTTVPTSAPGTTVAPDPTGLPSLSTPDAETVTGTLDNGLRYLVRRNDNPGGKAEMRLVVDAGSGLEDDDQVGGAHFLEHMLFNGTEKFPKNELIAVLRSFGAGFGADINASTSRDETVYELSVPNEAEVVDTGLDVLEQWLSHATIAPEEVEAERGVILDEWRSRTQTSSGRVFDRIADFFLAGSQYEGHSPIGGREAIEALTPEALRRFYDDWYRPDNAAVIVVGEIDVERVEAELIERFAPAVSRGTSPARADISVPVSDEARAAIVGDDDQAEGFAFVTLPGPVLDRGSLEADSQWDRLEALAFDIVATRLDNDALRGEAPYEDASRSSSSFVRMLSAPEISVSLDGDALTESVTAILEEYERVERFGVTQVELDRAVAAQRSSTQRNLDGSESRQDRSYADEYVRHILEDEWYVTSQQEFDFVTEVLDRATVETVNHVFVDRYTTAAAHIFAALPTDEVADAGTADELLAVVASIDDRPLEARPASAAVGGEIMERPAPVTEVDTVSLATDPFTSALDPTMIVFENGVRVAYNTTTIVENQVVMEARSPGGSTFLAADDIADGTALASVLSQSGVADFDRVALEEFLDDKAVSFVAGVEPFTDTMAGDAATPDLEVLFQMIHLMMTAPRIDEIALDRYIDDELPFAEDPGIDQGYASFDALLRARYGDDERFLLPTVESLATVDVDGIRRVAQERFGNASDWTFSFSGDVAPTELIELSRSYLGTLPGGGVDERSDATEPPPPPGTVVVEVQAGQGETASVAFLFTSAATADRRDDIVARVVQEVIGNRLTDFIREELGDSYSPFGRIDLGVGATPAVETYISVTTSDELVPAVSQAVLGQLDDLRANGPNDQEFTNAVATVSEQLGFINNGQINDEVLDVLVDPLGNASFDDFVDQFDLVGSVSSADVDAALDEWITVGEYVEIRVLPRS